MPSSAFLERLEQPAPVVCDGAMGTLLYAKGIFINRCYDELNLSHPDLIRGIHADYLSAGAEVIETNTFGANRYRLERHGCADHVHDINLAGARLAREAAKAHAAFVAGSVGPIGIRIEPLGKTARDEARAAFAEQIAALAEGGVDLLILETFGFLDELHQAVLAAQQTAPHLPVLALVTVDEDGNALDGAEPNVFTPRLASFGTLGIGFNCSVGPVTLLDSIERLQPAAGQHLCVMPNAGMPRSIEGRNIYLCSPEYMASYARKFVAAGAKLVGGCCGTTPEHIRAMKAALRVGAARARIAISSAQTDKSAQRHEPKAMEQCSALGAKIGAGSFVTLVEIVPPKGTDASKEIGGATLCQSAGIDAINIPDSPRASARMSNQALCLLTEQRAGIETILHYTCRDRNVLGIQSDLLGAYALGIRNLLCITGDPPKMGNYPDATAVFDVDSIGLVNIVRNLNEGLDIGSNPIGSATAFTIGVGANPGVVNLDEEVRRFEYKVEAGAQYAITQPVFDVALLENISAAHRALSHSRDRGHLAAGQPAQCGVHEERAAGLRARRNPRAHGARRRTRIGSVAA